MICFSRALLLPELNLALADISDHIGIFFHVKVNINLKKRSVIGKVSEHNRDNLYNIRQKRSFAKWNDVLQDYDPGDANTCFWQNFDHYIAK